MSELTKDEFLARCANAYDAGLCTPERLSLMEQKQDILAQRVSAIEQWIADNDPDNPVPVVASIHKELLAKRAGDGKPLSLAYDRNPDNGD